MKIVTDNFQNYVDAYFAHSDDVKGVPKEISNKLAQGLTSTGSLEDLDRELERFKKFGHAGLTEISLRLHAEPMEALKIIGERVVPELRKI